MRGFAILLPSAPQARKDFWRDAFGGLMAPVRDAEPTGIILPGGREIVGWMIDFSDLGDAGAEHFMQVLAARKHPPQLLATFRQHGYPVEGNEGVVVISTDSPEFEGKLISTQF